MTGDEDLGWVLHPRLAADCMTVGDLCLSRVLLMDDATYPWLILVPRRPGLTEIVDLDGAARGRLMEEIVQVSHALRAVTRCDKLNVAALGNAVPQLHVHVIARRRDDAAWPHPVWGHAPARRYAAADAARFCALVCAALGL
jgi:diadenosine tetraphosphate (Ap4A) HIT family hydrolase